jgi:hypothetical protein
VASEHTNQRWNPWRTLRNRPHIRFLFDPVAREAGGAFYASRNGKALIVIDPDMGQVERKAALAHELVHDERGGGADTPGAPAAWGHVVMRDERAVNRIVALRMVPIGELVVVIDHLVAVNGSVTPADIAAEFEVPEAVALMALELLEQRLGGVA